MVDRQVSSYFLVSYHLQNVAISTWQFVIFLANNMFSRLPLLLEIVDGGQSVAEIR